MGLSHSPKIVTNGLVFYMDQGNTQKSWKGAPATNLFTVTNLNNWSKSATTATSSHVTPHGDPAYDITDSNASGYSLIARDVTVANDSSSYTFSLFIKKTYGGTSAKLGFNSGFNTGGTQVAYNQRFNSDTGVANTGTVIDFGDWWYWYFTITNNSSGNTNLYCSFYPATGPYDSADNPSGVGTATIGGLMLVSGTTAVRFANGTRSNTQALLDLTGKNTITVVGTPTFNTDRLTIPNTNSSYLDVSPSTNFKMGTQDFTISAWVKQLDNSANTITEARDGSTLQGYFFCLNYPSAGQIGFFVNPSTGQAVYSTSVATLGYNVVQNITAVVKRSNATIELYVNGSLYDTITGIQTASISGTGDMYRIGYDRGGATTNMDIYAYSHYNKALSLQEVQQNFNALRGRYGI